MKKLLGFLCASIGTLIIIPAMAADMRVKAPILKAPPPPPSWTGCYIDAGGGYGMWNVDQHTETTPALIPVAPDTTDGGRGWLGRFGGGCDYQLGGGGLSNWVIGAFGQYDVMDIHGTDNFQNIGLGGVFGPPVAGREKESSAWYVGGRLGYLVTPTLLTYFDGGYTETRFDQQNIAFLALPPGLPTFLPATTFHGYFLGGGTEYALNLSWLPIQGLFWKNEYRFASYSSKDVPFLGPGATPGFAQHAKPFVQTATTSLVWRFNWGGPLVARY